MTYPTCSSCGTRLPSDANFCPDCGGSPLNLSDLDSGLPTLGGLETIGGAETRGRHPRADEKLLAPGTRFADRYVIESVVGAGGMGVVYRAMDSLTKQVVALKLIRPERIGGEREVQRMIDEGITARNVRHANVVAVYDVGQADGQPYLSMELIEGQSLRAWHRSIKERGEDVPFPIAMNLIGEIVNGLHAAHSAGVVHRDLKPENVMLLEEPTAQGARLKILDFGIARAVGTSTDSGTGSAVGTPRYMAPEQITQPDLAGPPADIYSLSVVFYELLVDVLPQGHWQPPSGGRSDVTAAIDDLIQRGLSNRPANRPQTAADYARQLTAADKDKLIGPLLGGGGQVPVWLKHKGVRIAIAVLGVLAIIGGINDMIESGVFNGGGSHANWDDDPDPEPWIDPDPDPEPEPDPPPREVAVENLSGTWHDGYGGGFDVFVDPFGVFSGTGLTADGFPIGISGEITGRRMSYGLFMNGMQIAHGSGRWDGEFHLSYRTKNPDGSTNLRGDFHVNHQPNGACP